MSSMQRNILCRTTPVSRARGHTAVGGAAYRAGENIRALGQAPDGGDKWFRYSGRADVVRETFIMTPEQGAPEFLEGGEHASALELKTMRAELWNLVEEMETHKKARLGREIQLGLAYELSHDEQREIIKNFVRREVTARGFVADIAIHDYGKTFPAMGGTEAQQTRLREWADADIPFVNSDEALGMQDVHVRERRDRHGNVTGYQLYQPHAHVRLTPRTVQSGEWEKNKTASRELNRHETSMHWRYEWPKMQNEVLERNGSQIRVRCTSDDEDSFPDVRFKGKEGHEATREIEERKHELSDEQRKAHEEAIKREASDRAFTEAHNEAIALGYENYHREQDPVDAKQERELRVLRFFKSVAQRYQHFKDKVPKQAEVWKHRLSQAAGRMRQWLGYDVRQDIEPHERDRKYQNSAPVTPSQQREQPPERTKPEVER